MWKPDPNRILTADVKAAEARTQTKGEFQAAIQRYVDDTARARNYGDGNSLAGYVNSTIPQWSAEAVAFVAWRDAIWVYSYAELERALTGQRPIPTIQDFIAELPVMSWPQQGA